MRSKQIKECQIYKLEGQDGTVCYVAYGKDDWNQWVPLKITEEDILAGRASAFHRKEDLVWYIDHLWDKVPRFSPYSTLKNMVSKELVESIEL